MRSRLSIARKIRVTAAVISGRRNGSLKEWRRGWRKAFTSSALAKPFLFSNSAMQGRLQISGQAMGALGPSSARTMIQRFCTKQIICARVLWQGGPLRNPSPKAQKRPLQDQRRVGQQDSVLFAESSKRREAFLFRGPELIPQTLAEIVG